MDERGEPESPERVLVTGGSGFVGTNLVEMLVASGVPHVRNLDLAPPQLDAHRSMWVRHDVRDVEATRRSVGEFAPDAVIHLAARTDLAGRSLDDYSSNTDGVRSVLAAVEAAGVARAVFTSSMLVCRPGHRPDGPLDYSPPNPYGVSKVVGEEIVREHAPESLSWVLVRPTTLWGPWWSEQYSAFFRAVRAGRYLHPRGVEVRKAFGYVGNAAARMLGLATSMDPSESGQVLYLTDDEPYDVLEWAREVAAAFDAPQVRQVPLGVLRLGAKAGDALAALGWRDPPLTSYRLSNILTETTFDLSDTVRICGPQPISRADGLRATVRWTTQRR